MPIRRDRPTMRLLALAGGALAVLFAVEPALGETKAKSIRTEGKWVKFDAEAKVVVVKVTKPGPGKDAKRLRRGREAEFAVVPEGSVLTRTTVAIRGVKAELTDIEPGKSVFVYWRPDEKDRNVRRARKIDVVMSQEEFESRFEAVD